MKNTGFLIIIIIAIGVVSFNACTKDKSVKEDNFSTVKVIDHTPFGDLTATLRNAALGSISELEIDGYILLKNTEFSNLNREATNLVIMSSFENTDGSEVYPDDLQIAGTEISNEGEFDSPTTLQTQVPDFVDYAADHSLTCTFLEGEEYNSFTHTIYHPAKLSSSTNQVDYSIFDRTAGLQVTWQVDNTIDTSQYQEIMYAYFAVPGSAVQVVQVPAKSGQATISSNEYSNIVSVNQSSRVGIIRLAYQIIEVGQKKIALIALQDSRNIYDAFGI